MSSTLHADAHVPTDRAERWLKQLVSHLSRKAGVLAQDDRTVLLLSTGRCALAADETHLHLAAEAEDAASLAHVQDVVTRHLERFAARERLRVEWSSATYE